MVDKLLTNSKQEWADQFKFTGVMKGSPLVPNAAIQEKYQKALIALVKQMTQQTQRELVKFMRTDTAKEFFTQDATISSQARMLVNRMSEKFSDMFFKSSKRLAEQMVEQTDKATASATHQSLKELSGGLSIKTSTITPAMTEILKASITENVGLIKSIPTQYFEKVQGAVMRSIVNGQGLQELVPFLVSHEGMTIRRARTIARDQTKKAYGALARERSKAAGIKRFEWIHTGAGREPRELHQMYSGQIFSYDDPPVIDERTGEKGFPGQAINCYCIARPIVEFDEGTAQ